jgi:Wzt C-terminal domain
VAEGEADGWAARLRDDEGEVRIRGVELLNERLLPAERVPPHSTVTVRAHVEYLEDLGDSEVFVTLRNKAGLEVFSASTAEEGIVLGEKEKGERVAVDFAFKVPLQHGLYNVTAAARAGGEGSHLDELDEPKNFRIARPKGRGPFGGVVHLPTEIVVHDVSKDERQGRSA